MVSGSSFHASIIPIPPGRSMKPHILLGLALTLSSPLKAQWNKVEYPHPDCNYQRVQVDNILPGTQWKMRRYQLHLSIFAIGSAVSFGSSKILHMSGKKSAFITSSAIGSIPHAAGLSLGHYKLNPRDVVADFGERQLPFVIMAVKDAKWPMKVALVAAYITFESTTRCWASP